MKKIIILILLAAAVIQAQVTVKIKDISKVYGIRDNQLIGYGLVVGLNGKGDSSRSKLTHDTASRLFENFNINIDPKDIVSKNIAAVIITALLPAFAEEGSKIDVKVSSVGDAQSIENGELLQTPLKANNGEVYAVAQGTVVTVYKNKNDYYGRMTVGYIPNGAIVEKGTTTTIVKNNRISLVFEQSDFTTINNAATAVNNFFHSEIASAKNNSLLVLQIPQDYQNNVPKFLSAVGNLEIEAGNIARVVIDRRSGTIIMGGDVAVSSVAISQKNLNLEVQNGLNPQPCFLDELNEKLKQKTMFVLKESADVKSVVDGLNKLGAKTEDIISILRALKVAGALHAQLIIM